ncbi:MAG TPA: hypothetical protein VMF05_07750 [Stellaceae bacterium]|nr:hypothetical protein [Stellaceae bacterium]
MTANTRAARAERDDRLGRALRENLRRRKEQMRARGGPAKPADGEPTGMVPPDDGAGPDGAGPNRPPA